jgi:hypothetical protein
MTELLTLAGFEVEAVHGLWLCAQDGRVLQLEERLTDAALTTRRIALGDDHVDQCFVWWINARRHSVDTDASRLRRRIDELFDEHWPVRVNRGIMANADDVVLPLPRGARCRQGDLALLDEPRSLAPIGHPRPRKLV